MTDNYYNLISVIDNFYRSFLELLKYEIKKIKVNDINNVQSIILYNMGDKTWSVGDLTKNGVYKCYTGSNVSYNLRKLVECGYVIQEPSKHDRRSANIKKTQKGIELSQKLKYIFEGHSKLLQENGINKEDIKEISLKLESIDRTLNKPS